MKHQVKRPGTVSEGFMSMYHPVSTRQNEGNPLVFIASPLALPRCWSSLLQVPQDHRQGCFLV